MTNSADRDCLTSACRYCRFYRPEGFQGGTCQQLGAFVRSNWKSCQLALPAFASSWENAEELATANWQVEFSERAANAAIEIELNLTPTNVNN
jgi:hypothetical protein